MVGATVFVEDASVLVDGRTLGQGIILTSEIRNRVVVIAIRIFDRRVDCVVRRFASSGLGHWAGSLCIGLRRLAGGPRRVAPSGWLFPTGHGSECIVLLCRGLGISSHIGGVGIIVSVILQSGRFTLDLCESAHTQSPPNKTSAPGI